MAAKLPITKNRIRNHFHYFWWQYLLLAIFAVFGWNLLYTTTHYRSPEHLRMEWYYEGYMSNETTPLATALMEQIKPDLYPDMEEVMFTNVGNDETYGDMQLLVWTAAGQGDLSMLTGERFRTLAASGGMTDLTPYIEDGTLNVEGIDLSGGYVTDTETGKRILYGIPTDVLTGLIEYDIDYRAKVMSVLITGGNEAETIQLLSWLLDNMR